MLNIGILGHISAKQYFPCNTHMLNISDDHLSFLKHTTAESEKHVFFLKHTSVELPLSLIHVHSLSRGVGETQRRKEYVTHLKHELKVSLCVCLPTEEVKHLF